MLVVTGGGWEGIQNFYEKGKMKALDVLFVGQNKSAFRGVREIRMCVLRAYAKQWLWQHHRCACRPYIFYISRRSRDNRLLLSGVGDAIGDTRVIDADLLILVAVANHRAEVASIGDNGRGIQDGFEQYRGVGPVIGGIESTDSAPEGAVLGLDAGDLRHDLSQAVLPHLSQLVDEDQESGVEGAFQRLLSGDECREVCERRGTIRIAERAGERFATEGLEEEFVDLFFYQGSREIVDFDAGEAEGAGIFDGVRVCGDGEALSGDGEVEDLLGGRLFASFAAMCEGGGAFEQRGRAEGCAGTEASDRTFQECAARALCGKRIE